MTKNTKSFSLLSVSSRVTNAFLNAEQPRMGWWPRGRSTKT